MRPHRTCTGPVGSDGFRAAASPKGLLGLCAAGGHDYSSEAMAAAAACLAASEAEKEAAARQAEAVVWEVHAPGGSQL
eukprot:scaffold16677_cov18-Phaeocystis_antarctica.AAC.1